VPYFTFPPSAKHSPSPVVSAPCSAGVNAAADFSCAIATLELIDIPGTREAGCFDDSGKVDAMYESLESMFPSEKFRPDGFAAEEAGPSLKLN